MFKSIFAAVAIAVMTIAAAPASAQYVPTAGNQIIIENAGARTELVFLLQDITGENVTTGNFQNYVVDVLGISFSDVVNTYGDPLVEASAEGTRAYYNIIFAVEEADEASYQAWLIEGAQNDLLDVVNSLLQEPTSFDELPTVLSSLLGEDSYTLYLELQNGESSFDDIQSRLDHNVIVTDLGDGTSLISQRNLQGVGAYIVNN